jgi:hypothetical protein
MVTRIIDSRTIEEVVAAIDVELQGDATSMDVRSLPTLALKLCYILLDSLSDSQKHAVEAARRDLEEGEMEGADHFIGELAAQVGKPYPTDTDAKQIARDRLIWIALNRHGPLSAYGVEFVLSFGEMAGIRVDQMLSAVREVLAKNRL